jgi:hypothetical protein
VASRDHGIFFGLSNQKEVSMLSRFGRTSLVSFLFLPFAATLLFAQSGTATLTGTVIDQAGAVLAGVKVVVRNPETGFEREIERLPQTLSAGLCGGGQSDRAARYGDARASMA